MLRSQNTQNSLESNPSDEVADLIELDPRVHEKKGPFEFWYRLTAPAKQPLSASFELREAARQGRLTSTVLAMVAGSLVILAIPTSFATNNPILLVVLCVLLMAVTIALILNKIGKGFAGRVLVIVAMNASLILSIITWPGGLTVNTLPIFDILVVEPILVTLALLPPGSVFIIALCNAAFIGIDFSLEPHSADLVKLMGFDGYEVVTRPLYLLIFVVGIGYPVMRSVLRAIALSDRAKEIAKVQHDLATREALVAQDKEQLDEDIRLLVDALTQIANGNMRMRLPYPTSPSLWPVSGALNNFYARVRSGRQGEYELQHTRNSAAALINAIRLSKRNHQPLQIKRNGNPVIDAIILELVTDRPFTQPLPYDATMFRQTGMYRDDEK